MAWHADIPSTPTQAANVPISGLLRRGVREVQNTEERETEEKEARGSVHLSISGFECVCVTRPQTSDIPFPMA